MTQAIAVQATPTLMHIVRVIGHLINKLKDLDAKVDASTNADFQETMTDLLERSEWFNTLVRNEAKSLLELNLSGEIESAVEYEVRNSNMIEDAVNAVFENADLGDQVEREFGSYAFDSAVESVIQNWDFGETLRETVDDTLSNIDWNDKFADYMRDYDFGSDLREAVEDVLENRFKARIHVMAQEAIHAALVKAANATHPAGE